MSLEVGEIYVRRLPDDGTKVRVSTAGGLVPRWSPNGRELLYRTTGQQVMVLPYQVVAGSFRPGTPRPWTRHTLAEAGVLPNFDVGQVRRGYNSASKPVDPTTTNPRST